ncbi:PTS cellobiose transporter subunit IIA [Clostridium gelidum]|uniref:PTS cellobiose transporter subunit IIA n=1 Tax=Clostridium gelidum TaxID=704125 RepID=A0ABM7TBS1_9CLOT|nr:PTS lactose/cellobiose transporter subunit IIA [Clostridium gelidum]BCZ48815.1 PTS cellobiose transporter subunit IIA [Clostridium gelidum]
MDSNEQIAFNIIANSGSAKSLYMEVLNKCEVEEFDSIDDMFKEAEEYLIVAHKTHTELIQKEARGEETKFSLLLMHAEDQLMQTETMKVIAQKFYKLYKKGL